MAIKTSDAVRRVAQLDGSQLGDYMALLKPRVMSLVVFTGFAGMVVAPGELGPLRAAATVLCIAVGAGAAAAINMRSEEHTSELQSLMRISYAVFCLEKKKTKQTK